MKPVGTLFILIALLPVPSYAFDLGNLMSNPQINQLVNPNAAATSVANSGAVNPTALAGISHQDQVGGLKQALTQGAESAVASLGKANGFLDNPQVRIPLPKNLHKIAELMRTVGMGRSADKLTAAMNNAAEVAVPEAKKLLVGAVQDMSVQDAAGILTGGNDAATQYFRRKTSVALAAKFKPIVVQAMQHVSLAQQYDKFASAGEQFGLVKAQDANLNDYITQKALDGLFIMMAQEEQAIRAHPLQAVGAMAQKVFSAISL